MTDDDTATPKPRSHRGLVTLVLALALLLGLPTAYFLALHARTNHRVDANTVTLEQHEAVLRRLAKAEAAIVVDRNEARRIVCEQYNAGVDEARVPPDALEAQLVLLVLYIDSHAAPEDQARIAHGIARYLSIFSTAEQRASAHRDCTPAGIEKFYASKEHAP